MGGGSGGAQRLYDILLPIDLNKRRQGALLRPYFRIFGSGGWVWCYHWTCKLEFSVLLRRYMTQEPSRYLRPVKGDLEWQDSLQSPIRYSSKELEINCQWIENFVEDTY
jgi:hypothetical protein